jgi:hypothetical protein
MASIRIHHDGLTRERKWATHTHTDQVTFFNISPDRKFVKKKKRSLSADYVSQIKTGFRSRFAGVPANSPCEQKLRRLP